MIEKTNKTVPVSDEKPAVDASEALLFSILETLNQSGVSISLVERLPLAALGFGWVVPALVFGLLGALLRTPGSFLSHEDSENLEGKLDVDMVL